MSRNLYRAVSPAELTDLMAISGFRASQNSLEGKWFAEIREHADSWGRLLYGANPFHIVGFELPDAVADQLFRLSSLDRIGPACYAEPELLALVNASHKGISEV